LRNIKIKEIPECSYFRGEFKAFNLYPKNPD
jgi:hypothetical protein